VIALAAVAHRGSALAICPRRPRPAFAAGPPYSGRREIGSPRALTLAWRVRMAFSDICQV